ncbi:hypothetical protein ACC806_34625 [Rhizobium ruizarguesonis]
MSELQRADLPVEADPQHMNRIMISVGHMVECVGMLRLRVRLLERLTSLLVFLLLVMAIVNTLIVERLITLGG